MVSAVASAVLVAASGTWTCGCGIKALLLGGLQLGLMDLTHHLRAVHWAPSGSCMWGNIELIFKNFLTFSGFWVMHLFALFWNFLFQRTEAA